MGDQAINPHVSAAVHLLRMSPSSSFESLAKAAAGNTIASSSSFGRLHALAPSTSSLSASPVPPFTSPSPSSSSASHQVIWINLCEEASIFVHEQSCALRDGAHPFRSLPEFRVLAMPSDRLEELEERMAAEARVERAAYQVCIGKRLIGCQTLIDVGPTTF